MRYTERERRRAIPPNKPTVEGPSCCCACASRDCPEATGLGTGPVSATSPISDLSADALLEMKEYVLYECRSARRPTRRHG